MNYDFSDFVSDYIHRCGRVGRVGSQGHGKVTSFISSNWEVELLWQIEVCLFDHKMLLTDFSFVMGRYQSE